MRQISCRISSSGGDILMKMTTDLDLLREYAQRGSEKAFAMLVTRHLDLVYSAALRQVKSSQLAEDIAQSVFTDLARNAQQLKPDTVLAAWLYQVTRRTALNVSRGEARRQAREQIAVELADMNATSSDWTQIEPWLDEAMETLDEPDRAAILLRYFENKNLRDVGKTLGVGEDAAQKRVSRAVERLREFFSKRNVTIGASGLVVLISSNAVQAAPIGLIAMISTAVSLAGTAIQTSAAIAATKTISMTALQKTLITAAFLVVTGSGIFEAHQASTLRHEVKTLQRQQAPLTEASERMQPDWNDGARQLAALRDDNEGLKRNTTELLKLRGEVTRLHDVEQQLAQLKQTIQISNESPKAQRIAFGTELQDMGAATPERAASSMIWAAMGGKQDRVSELLELPEGVSDEEAPKHFEFFTRQLSNVYSGLEFISVQSIKPNSNGTLRLNFNYRDIKTGKEHPFPFMMRLHDSGWKVVVEGKAPKELPLIK